MARSDSAHAQANSLNEASLVQLGGIAGNDTLEAGDGANFLAGDAMAVSGGTATADSENNTDLNGSAGNDYIYGGADNDTASGDAQARATNAAIADPFNQAIGLSGAGNDYIWALEEHGRTHV